MNPTSCVERKQIQCKAALGALQIMLTLGLNDVIGFGCIGNLQKVEVTVVEQHLQKGRRHQSHRFVNRMEPEAKLQSED